MNQASVFQGRISRVHQFEDGSRSYTVRSEQDDLFNFVLDTPLLSHNGEPLLRNSIIQARVVPVLDAQGQPRVDIVGGVNGTEPVAIARTQLTGWYLIEAAKSAEELRSKTPLIPVPTAKA